MLNMKKYEIKYHIADLCSDNNGFIKEINVVKINNREPVYEIRTWNSDHSQMGEGITLTPNEMRKLKRICESMDFQSIDGSTYKEPE